ncbi:MAG: hypothetical protein M1823_005190 [Watsoniomyces obsoletus]|nr:MAG: hypothetical protein M1823_005190 [Watsoniomyces obsoletus]
MAVLDSRDDGIQPQNGYGEHHGTYLNGHASKALPSATIDHLDVIDIRRGKIEQSLSEQIFEKLQPAPGMEKQMPTMLLYNETGLKLFEKITYLDEYYLTNNELEVLRTYADAIAQRIHPGTIMLELGSGNLRKIKILLDAIDHAGLDVDYYALDLSLPELKRTLSDIPHTYQHVKCFGLHGTYDDGLAWLKSTAQQSRPKCILSMGSSIGNFPRDAAVEFLKSFAEVLGSDDRIIIGLDACKDQKRVYHAYNDADGVTHQFIRNGLANANTVLGEQVFKDDEWEVIGQYNTEAGRHEAFYSPKKDFVFNGITVRAGEKVRVEESNKYSAVDRCPLWKGAGLARGAEWSNSTGEYHLHMLYKPPFTFPLKPREYAAEPVPTLKEWTELWAAWDVVATHMLPAQDLLSKPIPLRNPCIFYQGHIPTFLDIHLARALDGQMVVPAHYRDIFERGIDPEVEDPEHCHEHSKIPTAWPDPKEIMDLRSKVRNRVQRLYHDGTITHNRALARGLWLAFEHEAMHLETLMYILLQHERVVPPPNSIRPDFAAVAREADVESVENEWFTVPESTIEMGIEDPDDNSGPPHYFGWDNEKPPRLLAVRSFQAKGRPITVGEYALYLEQTQNSNLPASWTVDTAANGAHSSESGSVRPTNGTASTRKVASPQYLQGKLAKTVFGPIPLAEALHWPIIASYNELSGCARWMNGRIPTLEEVRSIYQYVDQTNAKKATNVLAGTISAVNGHLSNNGVQETPPSGHDREQLSSTDASPTPEKLFASLQGCNVGFTHWHPVPVSQNGNRLCGRGDLGGVWEWTSSVLERHEGFQPMPLYPAYTADFFDGKHNVIQGGSWATHPRIAGRRSFMNWYQRSYPYVWAGARIVRDI